MKVMLTLVLGILAMGGFAKISMAAPTFDEEVNRLMGEGNEQVFEAPKKVSTSRFSFFSNIFSDDTSGAPIVETSKRFSDTDLYTKAGNEKVAKELGISGKVIAVPRARAIQNGSYLDGNTAHNKPSTTWSIDGEYGFVPTFGPNTQVSIFKKDSSGVLKETKVYTKKDKNLPTSREPNTPDKAVFKNGEVGYVKFTNLGYYQGKPVTIVMEPTGTIEKQVYIGLLKPSDAKDDASESTSEAKSYMSVNSSGGGIAPPKNSSESIYTKFNEYGAHYVEINYNFYNANKNDDWKNSLKDNENSAMAVQGFYTYADFDFEESIGIPESVEIDNLYVLQSGGIEDETNGRGGPMELIEDPLNPEKFNDNYLKNDNKWSTDPLGLRQADFVSSNANPFSKYLGQYFYPHSDWLSQLEYSKGEDGYRYFNRGARSNTDPYRISNWLSFTYKETKHFKLRINVTPLESFGVSSTDSLRKLIEQNTSDYVEKKDYTGHEIVRDDTGMELYQNLMFYKIIENKLKDKGITKANSVEDVSKVLKFELEYGKYVFDESKDGDKVVIPFSTNDDFPETVDFSEYFWSLNLKDEQAMYEKILTEYYGQMYLKYQKQKVKNSRMEKLLDLMYQVITKPVEGMPYSPYGFNKKNVGNFFAPYKQFDQNYGKGGILENQARKASSTIPNSALYFFNSKAFIDKDVLNNQIATTRNLLRKQIGNEEFGGATYDFATSIFRQRTVPQGSNVYFTSDTLLPIGFPHPLKTVESDDSKLPEGTVKNEITWDVMQFVPPRVLNNYEPKYIFSDRVNPLLKIVDFDVFDVETPNKSEKGMWVTSNSDEDGQYGISENGKLLRIKPNSDWKKKEEFNNRHFVIRIKTVVDKEAAQKLTPEEFAKYELDTDGFTHVPNAGKVTMVAREGEETEYTLHTRPTYQTTPSETSYTYGKVKLAGNLVINKVAEEDATKKLKGAEFELWTKDDKKKIDTKTTDGNGQLIFGNVPAGTYILKETKAPNNYRPNEPQEVKVYPFNHPLNTLLIKNKRSMLVGEFETATKAVKDENKNNIDGQLVAYDQVLTYEISGSIKKETPATEINAVSLLDTLDSGLERVAGTTTVVKNKEPEVLLADEKIWSLNDAGQDVLDTSSQDKFTVGDGDKITFKFKVKVKHTAGKKIENTGKLKGKGLNSKGTEVKPEKITNTVMNYLSDAIHLRQVIVDKNTDLAIPVGDNKGFFKINNTDSTGNLTTYSTVNVSVPSGEKDKLPNFKKVMVSPTESSSMYTVNGIVPEMYDYKGYVMSSDSNQSIEMGQIKTGVPKIDLSKKDNRYVTLVMEPKEKKVPLFYNWDYKLNEFGNLNVKGKQVRIKFFEPQDMNKDDYSVPHTLIDLPTFGNGVLIPSFDNLDKYYYRIPYLTKEKHYQQGAVLENIVLKNITDVNQLLKKIPINLYFTDKDGEEQESINYKSNGITAKQPLDKMHLVGFSEYTAHQQMIDTKSNPNEIIIWYLVDIIPTLQDW